MVEREIEGNIKEKRFIDIEIQERWVHPWLLNTFCNSEMDLLMFLKLI